MRQILVWPLLSVLAPTTARAGAPYSYVAEPGKEIYFGRIAGCEGDEASEASVLHEGRADADPAIPNTPLVPGDTIVTGPGSRCEARLDTGTVIRLDGDTRPQAGRGADSRPRDH